MSPDVRSWPIAATRSEPVAARRCLFDFRTPRPDRPNALRNGVVDRQRVKHLTLVTDDARMHHLNQRIADPFGGDRSGELLLLDDSEKLQVACRASARERAGGRSMRHHAN